MQLYKIYKKGNYIYFEYADTEGRIIKKRYSALYLTYEKEDSVFKINHKNKGIVLVVEINSGLDELGTPYTEAQLETFLDENTSHLGSAGGGGAGDASASNQVSQTAVLNTLLKPANTLNAVKTIIDPLPIGTNSLGTVGLNTGSNTIGAVTNINLDVALSTRLKPADTLAGVTTVAAVTAITNALPTGNNTIGNTNQTITTAEFAKITDGTNTATVKASLGESSRTDKSLVVSLKANQASVGNVLGTITTALTSQVAIPINLERKGFEIFNNSTGDLIIGIGITPTLTQGFLLSPQSMYSTLPMMTFTGDVNIIGATIGQQFTYIEY